MWTQKMLGGPVAKQTDCIEKKLTCNWRPGGKRDRSRYGCAFKTLSAVTLTFILFCLISLNSITFPAPAAAREKSYTWTVLTVVACAPMLTSHLLSMIKRNVDFHISDSMLETWQQHQLTPFSPSFRWGTSPLPLTQNVLENYRGKISNWPDKKV